MRGSTGLFQQRRRRAQKANDSHVDPIKFTI